MDIKNIDLSVFKYKPFELKSYNELIQFDEFKKINRSYVNKFIDYVILALDYNTPLRKEYPFIEKQKTYNLQKIKYEAAKLAGFELNDGKFDKEIEDILLGKNKDANAAVTKFLLLFGRVDYIGLVAYEAILLELVRTSFTDIGKKDTEQRISYCMDKINEHTIKLYGGEETIEAKEALYLSAEKDIANYFPEGVAEMMDKTGELPDDWNPMYESLTPEEIKYQKEYKAKFLGKNKPKGKPGRPKKK
jgi:hypothetical protein